MGKDMTFWLFIGIFQGIVSETKAFRKIEDAKKAFYNFSGFDWDRVNVDERTCEEFSCADFSGSQISELQIEA